MAIVVSLALVSGVAVGCGGNSSKAVGEIDSVASLFRSILLGDHSASEAIVIAEDSGLVLSATVRSRAQTAERVRSTVTSSDNQEAACETLDWAEALYVAPSAETIFQHAVNQFDDRERAREFSEDLASLIQGDDLTVTPSLVCAVRDAGSS